MRGGLKWPVGSRISPQVVVLQGWAYVLVGAASLLLTGFLLFVAAAGFPSRGTLDLVLAIVVALLISGSVPYALSVQMSRR